MSGKTNRKRGHDLERFTVNAFKERGMVAKRHLEYQLSECHGFDVITDKFVIQCKRGRKYAPINKIEEITKDFDKIKLLVTRADHTEAMVALSLKDFLDLIALPQSGA